MGPRFASAVPGNAYVRLAFLAAAVAALLAFAATSASASLQRDHGGSFGSFNGEDPQALTVDQSNGDVYAVAANQDKVYRFNSAGLPDNFSAGPDSGTNSLSGFSFESFPSVVEVAVDNSGGSSDGNVYVGSQSLKVFASSGEPLATLTGTGTPGGSFGGVCGVAVDQSNGDVYLASRQGHVWRYSPSGSTVAESDYSGGITVPYEPCQLAVSEGSLYVHGYQEWTEGAGPLAKYATSDFALGSPPEPSSTNISPEVSAVATDPSNGDVYADEGGKVTVYSSAGTAKYSFGSGDFGGSSAGVAVRAGGNAYVSDPSAHEIDSYETTLEPGSRAHLFSFGSFNGEDPQALTVDQSNGDVYAVAANQDKVYRFNSAGLPDNFSAGPDSGTNSLSGFSFESFPSVVEVAVDNSGGSSDGNVYVGSQSLKVFASSGEPLATLTGTGTPGGSFGGVCGVAVDQSNGDVYLASRQGHVWRYSPSGSTVAESDYSGGITVPYEPCQLAVSEGSLYVHGYQEWTEGAGPLAKYATSDFALGSPPEPSSTNISPEVSAVATDPSNGDVYADEGGKVTVYSSAGTAKYSFGSGDFGGSSAGVAVRAGGNAYVSDPSAHEIDSYGPFSAPAPLLKTEAATNVNHVKATLHGHLDPNNSLPITDCVFEIGTDTNYTEAPVPCAEGSSFTAPSDVSAHLSGLTPGTTYHFRLHVTTGAGNYDGEDRSFEAVPASNVPEVATAKSTILSTTSSQLKGTVNPNANPLTGCHFEYVDDIAFQETAFDDLSSGGSLPCDQAPGSIAADFEDHEVTATATGLDPEQIYRFRLVAENANGPGNSTAAIVPGPPLVETTGSSWRTATTARLDSRVSPHGADTNYHFEYVTDAQFQANGFAGATSTPDTALITNEVQRVSVQGEVGFGQQFRLSFGGYTTSDITLPASAAEVQAALRALPSIGSPNVSVNFSEESENTHARTVGPYTITFQGTLGAKDVEQIDVLPGTVPASYLVSSTAVAGGPGDQFSFVSAHLSALQPNTTYHYRLVADSGTPGGPSFGAGMTVTTRTSDAPLSHGRFPGPVGSDRAWEQVSTPDTGGNGVAEVFPFADDGNSALYSVNGGTPVSEVGSSLGGDHLYAERTPSGWQFKQIYPTRTQAPGNSYGTPDVSGDLSQIFVRNFDFTGESEQEDSASVWHLSPGASPQLVLRGGGTVGVSKDGSRVIAGLGGSPDPDHPDAFEGLYDITSGSPRLISLLPDGSVPSCSARQPVDYYSPRDIGWISADGSHVFFTLLGCSGGRALYVRDLEAEKTTLIAENGDLLRSVPDAAFFTTTESLLPGDTGARLDVYRYDYGDESLDCVTCFGVRADVDGLQGSSNYSFIAVSADGSRIYFKSPHRLLPGAADQGIYRVDVASGDLAYVAPIGVGETAGFVPANGNAITPDGSVFVFRSSDPGLNVQNGPQNGGTAQYYLYDDNDRSLTCVSCPADGGAPRGETKPNLSRFRPIADDGTLVFATPTSLVSADQNTAAPAEELKVGADVYEWRDGRPLLVTDGLTARDAPPSLQGIDPSGRDAFFVLAAQLTPDSIDAYPHLYDARIGGGFEFPQPPPPCPLEVCQGTPKGVPEESSPSSAGYSGAGNEKSAPPTRCRKGKVRRHGRCITKPHKPRHHKHTQHRANNDRRASR
jgi:hypothetical protein